MTQDAQMRVLAFDHDPETVLESIAEAMCPSKGAWPNTMFIVGGALVRTLLTHSPLRGVFQDEDNVSVGYMVFINTDLNILDLNLLEEGLQSASHKFLSGVLMFAGQITLKNLGGMEVPLYTVKVCFNLNSPVMPVAKTIEAIINLALNSLPQEADAVIVS